MTSIDREATKATGLVIEQAAAQTVTPTIGLAGGAFGALLVPSTWNGGLTFTWFGVYLDAAGAEQEAPLLDTAGAGITSTVAAGSICEIPPAVMGMTRVRAKFTAAAAAQTLRLFVKG